MQQYKHKKPVVSYDDRKAIVEAIRYVDQVVPQTSMDKLAAWERYHFDVVFHGDDWKGSTMYEVIEEQFKRVGVDMVYFPYTQGTSSTILRKKVSV